MLIDLRHHIVTLAAVFLALAVGMVVGGSYISGSSLENRLSSKLEVEFTKLRNANNEKEEEIKKLSDLLKKNEEFMRLTVPILIDNKLYGQRIAVVQTGDYSEASQTVKTTLEEAGASVVSMTTLSDMQSQDYIERARRAVELITGETEGIYDPINRILGILAECLATGSNASAMKVLEEKGLLSISGEYYWRVSAVVLVGGSKEDKTKRAERVDLVLVDKLQAAHVSTVTAVEPSYALTSYIPVYHRKEISTVDNIDQAMGQVSLVFTLAGEKGNYGIKDSADRIAPERLGSR